MTGATGMLVSASCGAVHTDVPDHFTDRVRPRLDVGQDAAPGSVALLALRWQDIELTTGTLSV
jgi:hypothetical protein